MKIKTFVYGTLRPGDYNHDRFPGGVVEVIPGCKTVGKLYQAFPNSRTYPGARFDEEGIIIGDVLVWDGDSPQYHSVVRMEIGAGYAVWPILVEDSEGNIFEALGFHYTLPHGEEIESGNWFAEDAYPPHGYDFDEWIEDEYGEDFDWDDDLEDE